MKHNKKEIITKIRTYGDKVDSNRGGFNVPEDEDEIVNLYIYDIYDICESFTVVYIDSLLLYENKCYLQEYLDNEHLDDNLFED